MPETGEKGLALSIISHFKSKFVFFAFSFLMWLLKVVWFASSFLKELVWEQSRFLKLLQVNPIYFSVFWALLNYRSLVTHTFR